MVSINFFDDPVENTVFIAGSALAILLVSAFTGLDAQAKFMASDFDAWVSPAGNNTIQFSERDVNRMYWAASTSLGFDAEGDEKLFCGDVENGKVLVLRPADEVEESSRTSVSGSCITQYQGLDEVDIFIHTQPDQSCTLSEEDKDLESDIGYTGILCEEPAISPVSGRVSGLNVWKVEGDIDPEFVPVTVTAY